MNTMLPLLDARLDLLPDANTSVVDDVRLQVWGLLSTLYPQKDFLERRNETRYPFPYLVHITPVAADGVTVKGETVVVVGKHLSEQGLGFYHPMPLPFRRAIASLENNGRWVGFLIDLKWCRFTRQGWYESGGRILESVPSPMEQR
ncbi:MAG: hypothetical protein IT426_17670 [Pirellulales bacterium]|nr:hypothetical protein [Pirellulales bacterium]